MSESVALMPWIQEHVRDIVAALRQDKGKIILTGVLLAVLGFIGGAKVMKSTESTVHLVVAPMPSQGGADMIEPAPKMDITSIALLCKSDEVLQRTLDKLNQSGKLADPLPSIRVLSNSLRYEITVSKETPMDKTYSDILELRAKAPVPEDAALVVNTWAQEIIDAVDRYEAGMEGPLLEIFGEHYNDAEQDLTEQEEERERWYVENNDELIKERQMTVSGLIMEVLGNLSDTTTELTGERAKAAAYRQSLKLLDPKLAVSWSLPEAVLMGVLRDQLGIDTKGEEEPVGGAVRLDNPAGIAEPGGPAAEEAGGPAALPRRQSEPIPGQSVLTQEVVNETYWDVCEELMLTEPNVAGLEARKQQLEELLAEHQAELDTLNKEYRRMETEKERVERRYNLAKEVHDIFYARQRWLEIANQVDYHTLQLLSSGTVWPSSRLWGFAGAAVMGSFGFAGAAFASLLFRLFLQPAFSKAS